MVNYDDIKDEAKDKLHQGNEKLENTKDRLFGKDQNGDDDLYDDNQDGMNPNEP
ncbi:MAG: hypothetical protein MUF85_01945 [Patescibacteria group bacterium]|jgi:hypothetical protein|nr:hypothetical protein [Patescibacteria group bacterium]